MTDEQIIALFEDRNEKAISELGNKYGNYCTSIAINILRDRCDTEECVNDAYLSVWKAIPPARPDDLRMYLAGTVRNASISYWRKMHAEKRGSGHIELLLEELSDVAASDSPLEKLGDTLVLKDVFNRFLDSLKQEPRRIFLLRYWYMDKIEEISEKLGISENKVKVSLHRTRKKLKKLLEKEGLL